MAQPIAPAPAVVTQPQGIQNFYTFGSFLSLTAAATIVTIVVTALSSAFDWRYHASFPFFVALAVSLFGDAYAAYQARQPGNPSSSKTALSFRIPLVFLNGCLIYTTAVGGAALATKKGGDATSSPATAAVEVKETAKALDAQNVSAPVRRVAIAVASATTKFEECLKEEKPGVDCATLLDAVQPAELRVQTTSHSERALTDDLLRDFSQLEATAQQASRQESPLARLGGGTGG